MWYIFFPGSFGRSPANDICRFVVEISKVQTRPDNLPPSDPLDPTTQTSFSESENKKDR